MGRGRTSDVFWEKEAEARETDQQALQGQKHPQRQRQEPRVRDGTETGSGPRGCGHVGTGHFWGARTMWGVGKAWGRQGGSCPGSLAPLQPQ